MRFTFDIQSGILTGPQEYMESESYRKTMERVQNGTHVLIGAFPSGTPIKTIVEVIFQTDFAGWLGMKQMDAMSRGAK